MEVRMTIDKFHGPYRFLSNFWEAPILIAEKGLSFPSTENAYQASKIRLDHPDRIALMHEFTRIGPGEAKRKGRSVPVRSDWDRVKLGIMTRLISLKFGNHPALGRKLALTDPHELVEGNTWGDRYWGVCGSIGENHLGRLLMAQRELCLRDHRLAA
jgi:ribA/ribD-fused uncharacterized protein